MLSKLLQPHLVSSTLKHNDYYMHVERGTNLFVKELFGNENRKFDIKMNFI